MNDICGENGDCDEMNNEIYETSDSLNEMKGDVCEKRTAADGKRTAADGKRTAADGKRTAADGKRTAADGKRTAADGKRTAADGKRTAVDVKRSVVDMKRNYLHKTKSDDSDQMMVELRSDKWSKDSEMLKNWSVDNLVKENADWMRNVVDEKRNDNPGKVSDEIFGRETFCEESPLIDSVDLLLG